LKGRDFSPAVRCTNIAGALAPEGISADSSAFGEG
jgi:hypothetical protein